MLDKAVNLTKSLVACKSVTPDDGGSLKLITEELKNSGFCCKEINRRETKNLYAKFGSGEPSLLFAGHVDVVPPGKEGWYFAPFEPTVEGGYLYGRGTQDMKTSDACFIAAAQAFVEKYTDFYGSISLLLTSDEEGDGADGTKFVLEELKKTEPAPNFCIVGEPSCSRKLGDTVKTGRRGSLNGVLTVRGIQGHVAYPEKVKNPIHAAAPLLSELSQTIWDEGFPPFPATSFQISNIHSGTGAVNVVPGECKVTFNLRYNPSHTAKLLEKKIEAICERHKLDFSIDWQESADPFFSDGTVIRNALARAIEDVLGMSPEFSTSGGTSDGRFIRSWCHEVVEFGPVNDRIHKVNERIPVNQIKELCAVYFRTLEIIFLK